MDDRLRVLAIEPYCWQSHRMFLEGYQRYSSHRVDIWSLPARKWKWRMRGSAYHFAHRARTDPPAERPDVIIASDFLNLADWKALCPRSLRDVPCLLYFHENQLNYPLSAQAPVEYHYGWINLSSALAADAVLFNSSYQRELFLAEVERVLRRMPDHVPPDIPGSLRRRSDVFPVGLDFEPHERIERERPPCSGPEPVILWNHRWEYDKDPERFVDGLLEAKAEGRRFRVVICGDSFGKSHPAFERAKADLPERIDHLGYLESADEYRRLVSRCDIVVSTARHEFFGVSVVEAMFLGCLPLLPHALSYPEIVPPHLHPLFLYDERTTFSRFLSAFLDRPPVAFAGEIRAAVGRFHWRELAPDLDTRLRALVADDRSYRE